METERFSSKEHVEAGGRNAGGDDTTNRSAGGGKRHRQGKSSGGDSDRSRGGTPKKRRQAENGGSPGRRSGRGRPRGRRRSRSRGPGGNNKDDGIGNGRRRSRKNGGGGGSEVRPAEGQNPFVGAAPESRQSAATPAAAAVSAVDRPLSAKRGDDRKKKTDGRSERGPKSGGGGGGKSGHGKQSHGGHRKNDASSANAPRRKRAGGRDGGKEGRSGGKKKSAATNKKTHQVENRGYYGPGATKADSAQPHNVASVSIATVPPSVSQGGTTIAAAADPECNAVLPWYSPKTYVPRSAEEALTPTLMHWDGRGNGRGEFGMMRDQPVFRLPPIRKLCRRWGVDLIQALSLRRHLIKERNPKKRMPALGLGSECDIRAAAALFEECVREYLRRAGVEFVTEDEQKRRFKESSGGGPLKATPDFILERPARLTFERCGRPPLRPRSSSVSSLSSSSVVAGSSSGTRHQREEGSIRTVGAVHWVEAKMFYGASVVEQGNDSAVGRILSTAEKYVRLYGPGAMVFSYGCGEELAHQLGAMGVAALDAHPMDLSRMEEQQRGWCGNEQGMILP